MLQIGSTGSIFENRKEKGWAGVLDNFSFEVGLKQELNLFELMAVDKFMK